MNTINETEVLKAVMSARLVLRTITRAGKVLEASELGILTIGRYAIDGHMVSAAEYRRAIDAAIDKGIKSTELGTINKYGVFAPFELIPEGSGPITT